MRLPDYIAESKGNGAALAAALSIAPSFLSQIAHGHRPAAPSLCVQIERITETAVRRWDLRPEDWFLIWPELIGQPGAPAVPSEARAA